MSFKTKALVAALALAAVGSANATLKFGNATTQGNSSLSFVAMSADLQSSLVVDLAAQFADVVAGGALRQGAANTASWNLSTGVYTVNGVVQAGTYDYSNAASFISSNTGAFTWGVIAGDGVGGAASASNRMTGQNILFTSTALDFDNSEESGVTNAAVSNGQTNVSNLYAANNTVAGSKHTAGKFGSSVATAGTAFLGTSVAVDGLGTFGQQIGTNNFLVGLTDTAYVMVAQLSLVGGGLPTVGQLGGIADSAGSALDVAQAVTFTFDEATSTLTYSVSAVPEVSTYAMLLAGLGAVGFLARRRRAA
ncbi:PEP-CTERM sorting domain-containing protein [Aquabacterium sp. OR-4]|uniref:PEP-CTERM sorting domain-containing protein n=1 Tax=Aquabacterium sp. OR-4 TaxID=2978127 RepID=UPI0028C7B931|nr:PEP-CTERM sorting domain-containing protein [Aquabacterium sp. OR-4]MDT7838935.1 PEP-CTERM sorting domain-containing protein [Aquabacterium sp. OR-4]